MSTKILVVDDEPDIRLLLKDILEDEGYEVNVAENAIQAAEQKQLFSPDLILLDIWMPDMDGVTLLKQWNEQKSLVCPVVMMSGHGTVETAVEATRFGAFDFVEKPLSTAKLLRTVNSALSSRVNTSDLEKPEQIELPVGNSHQMQVLRQTMKALAQDLSPVYLTGQPGSGIRIWARYLYSLQKVRTNTASFYTGLKAYQNGLSENVFIPEVTDLNLEQQKQLLSLINHLKTVASRGRLIVASQSTYDALMSHDGVLPELAEHWRQAMYIPSLNERIEDIPELVEYYVTWYSEKESLPYRHFGVAGQNMFRNHFWQGGLTELKSVIRQILANSTADNVDLTEIQQFLNISRQTLDQKSLNFMQLSINLDLDLREAREFFERN